MKKIRAWHFVGDKLRDGSPIPKDGEVLKYFFNLKICASGLHASKQPFDALQYAPGATLCYVECGGEFIHQDDKFCCTERTIIARMDATEMLRYFARQMAISVIHLYPNGMDDVVFDFLATGDKALRAAAWAAAWDAARDAAWDAARDAARAALRAAARDATGVATGDAARDAARAALRAAAWDAARDAAGDEYRNEFNQLVYECFEDFI